MVSVLFLCNDAFWVLILFPSFPISFSMSFCSSLISSLNFNFIEFMFLLNFPLTSGSGGLFPSVPWVMCCLVWTPRILCAVCSPPSFLLCVCGIHVSISSCSRTGSAQAFSLFSSLCLRPPGLSLLAAGGLHICFLSTVGSDGRW